MDHSTFVVNIQTGQVSIQDSKWGLSSTHINLFNVYEDGSIHLSEMDDLTGSDPITTEETSLVFHALTLIVGKIPALGDRLIEDDREIASGLTLNILRDNYKENLIWNDKYLETAKSDEGFFSGNRRFLKVCLGVKSLPVTFDTANFVLNKKTDSDRETPFMLL